MIWRRILVNLAAIAVAAVLVAGGYLVLAAPPLAFASSTAVIGAGVHDDEESVPHYDFAYADRGEVRWGVEVRNTLPFPVTVRGLASTPVTDIGLIRDPELHLLRDPRLIGVDAGAVGAFEPVTLASGDSVFLAVAEHFADCATARQRWAAGSGLVRSELDLVVSIFDLPRTATVVLPFSLEYSAPGASCDPA